MKFIKNFFRNIIRELAIIMRYIGIIPPELVFQHLYRKGPFTVQLPQKYGSMRLMSWGDKLENKLFWLGWDGQEPNERRWWGRAALDASCVLDIGANTGTYGFFAKALSPNATVHAFEPIARIAALAEENREISGLNVTVFQMAVADQEGELPIYDPGGANAYSASLDAGFLPGNKDSYLVPVTTIDAHCAAHNLDPDLIKIDVEGVEGKVLVGAEQVLARKRAIVLCEWRGQSEDHAKARNLLERMDYACIDLEFGKVISLEDGREHDERNIMLCPTDHVAALLESGPLR